MIKEHFGASTFKPFTRGMRTNHKAGAAITAGSDKERVAIWEYERDKLIELGVKMGMCL